MRQKENFQEIRSTEDLNKRYMELLQDMQKAEYNMWKLSSRYGVLFWTVVILGSIFTRNVTVSTYFSISCLIGFIILIIME